MEPRLDGEGRCLADVGIVLLRAELEGSLDSLVLGRGRGGLQAAGDGSPVRPDFFQVDGGGDDLDVVEAELGALGDCYAVRGLVGGREEGLTHQCRRSLGSVSTNRMILNRRFDSPMIMAQPSKYRRSPL